MRHISLLGVKSTPRVKFQHQSGVLPKATEERQIVQDISKHIGSYQVKKNTVSWGVRSPCSEKLSLMQSATLLHWKTLFFLPLLLMNSCLNTEARGFCISCFLIYLLLGIRTAEIITLKYQMKLVYFQSKL